MLKKVQYHIPHDRTLCHKGFSLAEILVALVISSMVLVAVLSIYQHVQNSAVSVLRHLNQNRLPDEVLQLIAEDLDQHGKDGLRVRIKIENKREKGMPVARLIITKHYFNQEHKEELFEEIIWQGSYNFDADAIVLYRSHSGLALEDRLLDQQRDTVETLYPFIPVCSDLTTFKIEVLQGEHTLETWQGSALPPGIRVILSFAEPRQTLSGELDVAPEDQLTRVIAIDRTRLIRFNMMSPESNEENI